MIAFAEEEQAVLENRTAWQEYPVFYLDFNTKNYTDEQALVDILNLHLDEWEAHYSIPKTAAAPEDRFRLLTAALFKQTGKQVVILVDEYDKPLLQNMTNAVRQEHFRNSLKAFYSVLKTQDRYIEFALLTGVTKFSKVSVFSDLNNLNDISMDRAYATICGITEEEIDTRFKDSVKELARANGLTIEETRARLKELYDGYHFLVYTLWKS